MGFAVGTRAQAVAGGQKQLWLAVKSGGRQRRSRVLLARRAGRPQRALLKGALGAPTAPPGDGVQWSTGQSQRALLQAC